MDENNDVHNGAPRHNRPDPVYAQYSSATDMLHLDSQYKDAAVEGSLYASYEEPLAAAARRQPAGTEIKHDEGTLSDHTTTAGWGGVYETRS